MEVTDKEKEREVILAVCKDVIYSFTEPLPVLRGRTFEHSFFALTVSLGVELHLDSSGQIHVLTLIMWVPDGIGRCSLCRGSAEEVHRYLEDLLRDPEPVLILLPDFYRSMLEPPSRVW